jgi:hypothetical protein
MREELLSYPTTFSLKPEQLKRLGEAARTLLDTSEGFQRLLRVLRGEPRMGEGIGGPKENCS